MISAMSCKINSLAKLDEYCSNKIEPLLLNTKNTFIYFGKYNFNGTKTCIISKLYAKDPPKVKEWDCPEVYPKDLKKYLEALGYTVDWVEIKEQYSAGYSSSKKTRYYNAGYNTYYSLKISF